VGIGQDKDLVWKEHVAKEFLLDFNGILGAQTEDSVAYAVTYIVAPEELKGLKMKAAPAAPNGKELRGGSRRSEFPCHSCPHRGVA
jgi:hypothetical protein